MLVQTASTDIILPMTPLQIEIEYIFEDFLVMIMFFVLVIIFTPQANPVEKGFPVEIFGFIYSIIFMYYNAGVLVYDVFHGTDSITEDMYIYGYSVTVISYVICIVKLNRLIETRNNFFGNDNTDDAGIYYLLRDRFFWRTKMVQVHL